MRENRSIHKANNINGLGLSIESLKGKQSVRTTFQLPDKLIELLGLVASQFGVKQKSLFDQLLKDTDTLMQLADTGFEQHRQGTDRRPKTYVISKRSLDLLDSVAKSRQVPRDFLVEHSIRRLMPVLRREQEKHQKRRRVYDEAERFLECGESLQADAAKLLGEDDQLTEIVQKMIEQCREHLGRVRDLVEKGESVAQFAPTIQMDETYRRDSSSATERSLKKTTTSMEVSGSPRNEEERRT